MKPALFLMNTFSFPLSVMIISSLPPGRIPKGTWWSNKSGGDSEDDKNDDGGGFISSTLPKT